MLLVVGSPLGFGGANLFLLKGLVGWGTKGVGWPGVAGPLSPPAPLGIFPEGVPPGALPPAEQDLSSS